MYYFVYRFNVMCYYFGLILYSLFILLITLNNSLDNPGIMSPHAVQTRKFAHKKRKIRSGKKVTLHHAANCGDLDRLKIMLRKGADIDGLDVSGHTALHMLVEYGDIEGAKLLIMEGADLDIPRRDGSTVVHIAASHGQEQLLKILLDHNAQVNIKTNSGHTPLHLSVLGNHLPCVKLLLRKGAFVNAPTVGDGKTPLHLAILNSKFCIESLVEERADIYAEDFVGVTPLEIASELGVEYMRKLLPRKGRLVAPDGTTPVHIAARCLNHECLKYFIDEGCDVNLPTKTGDTPLHFACLMGTRVNRIFGVSFKITNTFPTNIDLLVKAGANINKKNHKGLAPIHICALYNHLLMLEKLLRYDVDVNMRGGEKRSTALHIAAENASYDCLVSLVEHGADINAVDKEKNTVLMLAGRKGDIACVRYLLKNNAFLWCS